MKRRVEALERSLFYLFSGPLIVPTVMPPQNVGFYHPHLENHCEDEIEILFMFKFSRLIWILIEL